jgi:hypothetical protein
VQHAHWLMKTQDRQSLDAGLRRGPARKDSAVRVSLSSYHNVKEPVEEQPKPHSRTHNGSKSPIESQRQPRCLPRRTRSSPASVRWIARSRTVPQEVGSTRAKWLFRDYAPYCQAPGGRFVDGSFSPGPWPQGHNPARIRRHSFVVNGVVTIRDEYG